MNQKIREQIDGLFTNTAEKRQALVRHDMVAEVQDDAYIRSIFRRLADQHEDPEVAALARKTLDEAGCRNGQEPSKK